MESSSYLHFGKQNECHSSMFYPSPTSKAREVDGHRLIIEFKPSVGENKRESHQHANLQAEFSKLSCSRFLKLVVFSPTGYKTVRSQWYVRVNYTREPVHR